MPAPPHDDSGHTWHHPDEVLFGITKNGLVLPYAPPGYQSDMPAFAGTLSDEEIRAVLAYIASRWSGEVMEPVDGIAFIGRNPLDAKNVYVATGDSGNGMTHGTIAGLLISDLILKRKNAWSPLYDPSRITLRALPKFVRPQSLPLPQSVIRQCCVVSKPVLLPVPAAAVPWLPSMRHTCSAFPSCHSVAARHQATSPC
jgi:hypothetical protein